MAQSDDEPIFDPSWMKGRNLARNTIPPARPGPERRIIAIVPAGNFVSIGAESKRETKAWKQSMKTKNPAQDPAAPVDRGRRALLAAVPGLLIVPRHVLGGEGFVAPSDRINIAAVGAGGRGEGNIRAVAHENIYALCDIDDRRLSATLAEDFAEPFRDRVASYRDYRRMLDENPEIDAVVISTPDHMHAPIATAAMDLGKHVYVEKPLSHTVAEARHFARRAREANVVTQMGNQGHAGEGARQINEWVASGELGAVREVHCWTNRPVWPQGVARPEGSTAIPVSMDWNLWLGAAPARPYVDGAYHPFNWRGWVDFGTGVVGDMGAHIIDHPYWALGLDLPHRISASSTRWGRGYGSFPLATRIHFEFAASGGRPAVKMTWHDGGLMPERPAELESGRQMGDESGGALIVGERKTLMHSVYGGDPVLIPESVHLETPAPPRTLARSNGIHQEWIDAIKDRAKATTSDFGYAARLTETMLLGNIAARRAEAHKVLEYDGEAMRFTNDEAANAFLDKEYRTGFGLS